MASVPPTSRDNSDDWPGKRLGLPASGPRSVGRLGRRIGALVVDWLPGYILSLVFFGGDPWLMLWIFAGQQILFMIFFAGSIGHLLFGMRVVPVQTGWIGVWRPVVRTVLLCLVIPAVIWDHDQRGLHDLAAGTVLVRV
jgi:uncharacterized RDD family membrane protein YckC